MKRGLQFLPRRQSIIYAVTERMLRETGSNRRTFAMAVAETYLAITPEDDRTHAFRLTTGGKVEDDKKHNGQILGRYLDGVVKTLPADLEDAWVLALPPPYRDECERELAARRGMLAVRLPEGDDASIEPVAPVFAHYSGLVQALSPALADGRLGPEDRAHVPRIKQQGRAVITAILALECELDRRVYGEAGQ